MGMFNQGSAMPPADGLQYVFDTETTGLHPSQGHRVVEIGIVEIRDLLPTGREYHQYFNPQRNMPKEAEDVHGLNDQFLRDKPLFGDCYEEILEFVGSHPLVAHNAKFDERFLNAELRRVGRGPLQNRIVDTFEIARKKFPAGTRVTLDALCKKFNVSLASRSLHGALIDSHLLAKVYLHLHGGLERKLDLGTTTTKVEVPQQHENTRPVRPSRALGVPSACELEAHNSFIRGMKNAIWNKA
ncbi:DNA polymerase III subunit epsilon [Thalassospira xiamenensis]|uniref:DNA polymerase III subunit epsilon n=1 Tax=Thalassospira xiamenensis TaxID=220697 RepID=A0A285TTP7_9PROT|nr:DNA polymerase III subunit epsilon [Thalassospira xiamenensis]SOC27184.1 DNA polymerase-3 subunit epsilon [Thalassospira xiamenensis]